MKKVLVLLWAMLLVLGVAGISNAALIDRGGGLIYDSDQNITWLQDANYGEGSSYDDGNSSSDGRMTWDNAVDWADDLEYYDSVRNVTWTEWRLPTSGTTVGQYNEGEMG